VEDVQIGIACHSDVSYVVSMFAAWICGAVAVPLSTKYPAEQLEYFFTDSQARLVVAGDDVSDDVSRAAENVRVPLLTLTERDYTGFVGDTKISKAHNVWVLSEANN